MDYVYSPELGSQERGGYSIADEPAASWDDRPADGMSASFTTEPLTEDKVLLGTASIDLFLSSTAPDTDLEITLSEVRPDDLEVFVQQGWLRASHRAEDPAFSTELRPFQTHQASTRSRWYLESRARCGSRSSPSATCSGPTRRSG